MAVSTKYGKVNIPKIRDNEPVFILRAQDKLAEAAIGMYKLLAASHGSKLTDSLDYLSLYQSFADRIALLTRVLSIWTLCAFLLRGMAFLATACAAVSAVASFRGFP
jgi:hypothetical protein